MKSVEKMRSWTSLNRDECSVTRKRIIRQTAEGQKLLAKDNSDEKLLFKMYKELLKLNDKETEDLD